MMEEDGVHRLCILSLRDCVFAVGWISPASVTNFHCRLCQCKCFVVQLHFTPVDEAARSRFMDARGSWQPVFTSLQLWKPGTNHCSRHTAAVMKMYIFREGTMGADGVRELVKDDAMRVETGDGRWRKCNPEYRNNGSHTMPHEAKKSIWNVMRKKCYFVRMKICTKHRLQASQGILSNANQMDIVWQYRNV